MSAGRSPAETSYSLNICVYLHIIHPISGKCNPHIEYLSRDHFSIEKIFHVFVGDSSCIVASTGDAGVAKTLSNVASPVGTC